MLRTVNHKNIIKLFKVYESEESINMILEYVEGGDLMRHLTMRNKFSEKTAITILQQVLEGLNYLHSRSIIHRDIKPDNIFIRYI